MLSFQRTLLPSWFFNFAIFSCPYRYCRFTGIDAQSQSSTALYIPGFDPQPISADVIGVGPDGRTTWALHQGKPDATDTASYADFIGTGKHGDTDGGRHAPADPRWRDGNCDQD
ncbi:hypothetical protein BDZ97DRAFT_1754435 [Flammula alnicola]|nr:hypothetical protein BDZ97DRAFT_1754435 [Flammula alnicola]